MGVKKKDLFDNGMSSITAVSAVQHHPRHTPGLLPLGLRIAEWIRLHRAACLLVLLLAAAASRFCLAWSSPLPFGYVWDFCHEPLQYWLYSGHYPTSTQFWQSYHPPLFFILGYPLLWFGHWISAPQINHMTWLFTDPALRYLSILPMLCSVAIVIYCYRIVRFFKMGVFSQVLALALVLAFFCSFVGFYATEVDAVLTAVMVAFLDSLLRYHARRRGATFGLALAIGIFSGLAVATKFSGLIALIVAGEVVLLRVFRGPARLHGVRDGLTILILTFALGSWKYLDNLEKYGTPFFGNTGYGNGLPLKFGPMVVNLNRYEFHTFRLGEAMALFRSDSPKPRSLVSFRAYENSIWTSLYVQSWTDMTFFSEPSRHGDSRKVYPSKAIPYRLVCSILILGLVPTALSIIGMAAVACRRMYLPLHLISITTMGIYILWALSISGWAWKTKYILFLLPAYVVYAATGLRWVRRRFPGYPFTILVLLLLAHLALMQVYQFCFALG